MTVKDAQEFPSGNLPQKDAVYAYAAGSDDRAESNSLRRTETKTDRRSRSMVNDRFNFSHIELVVFSGYTGEAWQQDGCSAIKIKKKDVASSVDLLTVKVIISVSE